ncbi:MAG: bifunctional phosphoribosylaminoimidazolecarboxamide formyltransferase/IMP cyclohydrolase, partial [Phycisphaerales bacterium]
LISVSDKTGLEAFARALVAAGVEIVSTGGTAKMLSAAGIPVVTIDSVTRFPEMMDGRVKTLHPMVHGGLLAVRDNPEHAAAMREHGIVPIDLVCVNLYPFEETVARAGVTREQAIEQIDIGGPSMIRSGAKNHAFVAVVTSPRQYGAVLAEMEVTSACTSAALRRQLAAAAFARTAEYDAAITGYLAAMETTEPTAHGAVSSLPPELTVRMSLHQALRYGENPHQAAAVYRDPAFRGPSVVGARQLHGKELSYNNLNDAAAALELARHLAAFGAGRPQRLFAAACIKHANPCGAALAGTARESVDRAIAGDPLAAFGGILACSGELNDDAAERLCAKDIFLEVLLAESFAPAAVDRLRARWQNLRILEVGPFTAGPESPIDLRSIPGGMLAQERDTLAPNPQSWEHKAGPAPIAADIETACAIDLMVRSMASNAVAIGGVDGGCVRLFGSGLGQVDRVTAARIATEKAGALARGAVAVSDAFFPFSDGPALLADAGVRMLVHAGGSKRDQETLDLCEKRGITCMVTGVRRFRH